MKNHIKRTTAMLLALVLCLSAFLGLGIPTAQAAEQRAEVRNIQFPREGDDNYDAAWGHPALKYRNGWEAKASGKNIIRAMESYSGTVCYCIEPGVIQNTGDSFISMGDDFWNTMLYLGGNDQFTHEYISKSLGKETIDTNTYGKSSGRGGSYSTNYQTAGRELMTPDEVRKLDNRKAILFIRGEDPVIDLKYDLKKHPNYHRTAEGGGKPYVYGTDRRSFAAVTLDHRLLSQAADPVTATHSFELLDPDELEAKLNKKENQNHESVSEKRKMPHRMYPRPRQG